MNSILQHKKKLLVTVALALWGWIAVQWYKPKHESIQTQPDVYVPTQAKALNREYTLELDYRDPFQVQKRKLKALSNPIQTKASTRNTEILKIKRHESKEIAWPKLSYRGMAVNRSKQKVLAWVEHNQERNVYQLHDKINDFVLAEIYADSIILLLQDQRKMYTLKTD